MYWNVFKTYDKVINKLWNVKDLKEGYEFILKEIKTSQANVYKYELKGIKSTLINSKKEMEISYNFDVAMNNKPELIQL